MTAVRNESYSPEVLGGEWTVQSDGAVRLRITECEACQARWFPPRERCAGCHSADVQEVLSDAEGVLYASSKVHIGAAGFAAPYVLGYLDISGVRVLVHVGSSETLPPDTKVRLVMDALPRVVPACSYAAVVAESHDAVSEGEAR